MYKYILDETHSEYTVYVNSISSSAGRYLSRKPHLYALMSVLLPTLKLRGPRIVMERNMGHNIGTTEVVSTTDKDSIYYARPLKTEVFSRFAKNRYPQVSNMLTIVAEQDSEGDYEVTDVWIGGNHPAFPGDKAATVDSREYWENHALVPDSQDIQSKTLTRVCPY